ncbi:MAG: hypothetical protein HGN29_09825 [Asgard group archaeon]|nr:hypothetical protein [Asgard group archaeon]
MVFALIPDVLLIIETALFFSFSIFAFIRAYIITRNISYFHFIVGLFLSLAGYIFASIPGYFVPEDNRFNVVLLFIILTNVFIVLAFLLFTITFIMIREDKLPIFAHLIALVIGATIILITDLDESKVYYDYTASFWKVDYSNPVLLGIASVGIVIFLVYFTLYLIIKFNKFKNTKQVDLSFVGFAILALWMVTFNVNVLKVARLFFFPLGILLFGIAVIIDPLNFLTTKRIPDEIILLSRFDQPIIKYNFKEKKIERDLEEIKLFIASGKIISESMNSYEKPKDLKLKNIEIRYIDLKGYQLISIGTEIDRNAIAALYTAFRKFRKLTGLDYFGASTVLSDSDETAFVEVFTKYLRCINATKKNEVKKKKRD